MTRIVDPSTASNRKDAPDSERMDEPGVPVEIRKYPNRRLYDVTHSTYVTLADVGNMIRDGHRIQVQDAKTGQDLTRTVLLQILLEGENSAALLPLSFLHKLIEAGNEAAAESLREMLSASMETFVDMVERVQRGIQDMTEAAPWPLVWIDVFNRSVREFTETWRQKRE